MTCKYTLTEWEYALSTHHFQRCELIEHWIAGGFLNSSGSFEEANGRGYDVLGTLHTSCLLEKLNSNAF